MDLPARLGAGFAECSLEGFAVEVVEDDVLAAIAAIHHVINGAGVLETKFAGHGGSMQIEKNTSIFIPDPYLTPIRFVSDQ